MRLPAFRVISRLISHDLIPILTYIFLLRSRNMFLDCVSLCFSSTRSFLTASIVTIYRRIIPSSPWFSPFWNVKCFVDTWIPCRTTSCHLPFSILVVHRISRWLAVLGSTWTTPMVPFLCSTSFWFLPPPFAIGFSHSLYWLITDQVSQITNSCHSYLACEIHMKMSSYESGWFNSNQTAALSFNARPK